MPVSLTLASRPQAPLKPRIWLAFVVGGSVVASEYAAGGLISLISSEPYRESVRAVTTLFAALAILVVFINRLAGSLARGTLLFDSPPRSRGTFLRAMAFVAILVGAANLELARAPPNSRRPKPGSGKTSGHNWKFSCNPNST